MTFVEVLELIGQRQEIVYVDKVNLLRTDQRFYARDSSNHSEWIERPLPPLEEDKFVAPRRPIEIPIQVKKTSTYVSNVEQKEE